MSLTVLRRRRLISLGRDDFRGSLFYFVVFYLLFFAAPLLLVFVLAQSPAAFLESVGLTAGGYRRGLLLVALGAPLAVLAGFIGSRDPALRRFYPFSKAACRSLKTFVVFEAAYVVFYYSAWEFFYRGVLFFPLLAAWGLVPALAVQTAVSTLHHWGHPAIEVRGAVAAGMAFGLVAYFTGSFLYSIFLHALVGLSTDYFIYRADFRTS